jgi:two-component sensor histidine kinase
LARANRKLTKSNWSGVTLAEIVREELEAFADRTTVDGDIVALRPQYAQNFTLVLHELATNAAKYGALSDQTGKISVSWAIQRNDSNCVLKFKWQEKDGPYVVPPAKHGFGSSLIRSSFPDVRLDYAAEGLSCEIDLPVADSGHESSAAQTASRDLSGAACKPGSPALN